MKDYKIEVLDSLRAFAALSVCLFHFVCTVTGFIHEKWIKDIFFIGQFGVQLFFVISGFVIPWAMYHAGYKIKDFFLFLFKRLARLEPPYVVSILVVLGVLFLRSHFLGMSNNHINLSLKQVMLHFGYLIPFFDGYNWLNEVYWTLAIEFQYYFLMAVLFVPLIHSSVFLRSLIYVSFVALSFIGGSQFLLYWLPVFLLGIILFLFKVKMILKVEYYIATGLILAFCLYRYHPFVTIYVSIPLIFILYYKDLKLKFLHFAGKFSYSIYLVHPVIGASLINVLSHHCSTALEKFGVIVLGLVVALLSAWFMYVFVERPSKMLSASVTYKKKKT